MHTKRSDAATEDHSHLAPSGAWRLLDVEFGFHSSFGPVFFRETADEHLLLGFRCTQRHMNPAGFCHGGALAGFADYAAIGAQYQLGFDRSVVPTVTLTVDFLQGVLLGDWVEARVEVTNKSGKMCHTQMVAWVDGKPALSSRGIFKLSSSREIAESPFYRQLRRLWPRAVARSDHENTAGNFHALAHSGS
ncbi:PaaI family thioesterase [Mesorhizobium sp. ANAO-SY3R2]|uniref:PaaI family thioesterase n=1 Tax=Mesorhizobium sp. ANAO-SY3R2 TaxID=3166644 RepID=UPI003671453A